MRAAIYTKGVPGKTAKAQERELRRLCQVRGWTVCNVYFDPPRSQSRAARLALIKDLLCRKNKIEAVCVWRIAMLGSFIDDLLWTLNEVHVRRGIHIVAPGDGIDTTKNVALTNVLKALTSVK